MLKLRFCMIHLGTLMILIGLAVPGMGSDAQPLLSVKTATGLKITVVATAPAEGKATESTLDLTGLSGAVKVETVELLGLGDSLSGVRLLVEACGPSRPKTRNPSAYCAAGDECNLVWLELDARLKIARSRSYLAESCLKSSTLVRPCTASDSNVQCRYLDAVTNQEVTVTFDLSGPSFEPRLRRAPYRRPSSGRVRAPGNYETVSRDGWISIAGGASIARSAPLIQNAERTVRLRSRFPGGKSELLAALAMGAPRALRSISLASRRSGNCRTARSRRGAAASGRPSWSQSRARSTRAS
jgi:hypothetical protein